MAVFEGFDVLTRVAEGSTGVVWQARQRELDRVVAIKELSPRLVSAPGFLDRFRAEAQILAGIDDPHVVAVYDYVESADRAYLVTEWVDGAALAAVLAEHGSLSPEQALGVLRGALTGLARAHDQGLVHRDVSPANILVDRQGVSKLADFGLAAPTGVDGSGAAVGTPAFASPEAARGAAMTPASDVYSAAAVLFVLLTGRPPYPGATVAAVLAGHINGAVPTLAGHGPKLADLLRRAMAKAPAERPPDARAFLAELEEAARDRYGADWLKRSSIAGLVGAAAMATGKGATAAAGASSVTTTQIIDSGIAAAAGAAATGFAREAVGVAGTPPPEVAAAVQRLTSPPRRRRRTRLPRGGAAAVIAAAVVLALLGGTGLVLANRSSNTGTESAAGKPSPSPSASPSPSPTPSPTPPAVPAFAGTYSFVRTVTAATGNARFSIGSVSSFTWKVTPTCAAGPCSAAVASSSGARYTLTYQGGRWGVVRPTTGSCLDTAGRPTGQTVGYIQTTSLVAAGSPDPSMPLAGLTGTQTERSAQGCGQGPITYTYSVVATRTGA